MNTPGMFASSRTCRWGNTPPQQPQRCRPGTAAKGAGRANMGPWSSYPDQAGKKLSAGRKPPSDVEQRRIRGCLLDAAGEQPPAQPFGVQFQHARQSPGQARGVGEKPVAIQQVLERVVGGVPYV